VGSMSVTMTAMTIDQSASGVARSAKTRRRLTKGPKMTIHQITELEGFNIIEGRQIDCAQSAIYTSRLLSAFTLRFTDGTLLKVDVASGFLEVQFVTAEHYTEGEKHGEPMSREQKKQFLG
jgi:hypothetical protein